MKLHLVNIIYREGDRSDDCERYEGCLLEPGTMSFDGGSQRTLVFLKQNVETSGQEIIQITRYFEKVKIKKSKDTNSDHTFQCS
jgi:hypothetical protein